MNKYKSTIKYCYIGYIVQAIINGILPLFFVIFHDDYGLSNEKLGALISVNFITQLFLDLLASKFGARLGYRRALIIAHILATIGLVFICVLPLILSDTFLALIIATLFFAVGGGLIEVMVSPIIDAMELDCRGAAMSLLHSFFCWGQVLVVALTTIFILVFGKKNWYFIPLIWAIIPFLNIFPFIKAPLPKQISEKHREKLTSLFKKPVFIIMVILMVTAGASEIVMSQWSSYFAEKGLMISKALGDLLGPCMFAVFMGISRVIYGIFGEKIPLRPSMLSCAILCALCYVGVGILNNPVLSLFSCALCGFSVGIMWPGTLSLAGERFKGGTAMFGILALAGDLGCSISPYLAGAVSGYVENSSSLKSTAYSNGLTASQFGIKIGILSGIIFPIITIITISVWYFIDNRRKKL